ncbi:MAG: hypothetical protein KAU14_04010, partial [Thermoplasmata archaeon]|nr:hypothetical protein [Thermoplasmata archaeon]
EVPGIDGVLERYDGDYLITLKMQEHHLKFWDFSYSISDNNKIIIAGSIAETYENDPRFLDENFTPIEANLIYHDNDLNWRLSNNDTILIKSKNNGGVAESGMKFKLYLGSRKKGTKILEMELKDSIPESKIPPGTYNVSNYFIINNSNSSNDSNLSIVTEHVPLSSYRLPPYYPEVKIGVTLCNNSTKTIEDVSIKFYDRPLSSNETDDELIEEVKNISINNGSLKRIVIDHSFDIRGDHIITVEVISEKLEQLILAFANITIVSLSW